MPLNRCMSSKGGERGRVALDESFRQDQVSIVTRLTPSGIGYVRSPPRGSAPSPRRGCGWLPARGLQVEVFCRKPPEYGGSANWLPRSPREGRPVKMKLLEHDGCICRLRREHCGNDIEPWCSQWHQVGGALNDGPGVAVTAMLEPWKRRRGHPNHDHY